MSARIRGVLKQNLPLLLLVAGIATFRTGYADWSHVPSGSMEPTLYAGDYVWIDKRTFGPSIPFANRRLLGRGSPQRGDVITFLPPHTDVLHVKRVIGMPGDVLAIRGRTVVLNGERLATVYDPADPAPVIGIETVDEVTYAVQFSGRHGATASVGPVVVPQGHYFVLGDYRDNSQDSRAWGFVDEERIMGRVTHVAVSFSDRRPWRERIARPLE